MDKISVDFEAAKREAAELEKVASELERLVQNGYQQILQELACDWRGTSAESYRRKAELLQRQIQKTAGDINTVAGNIRASAQRIYDTEMYAKQIAEMRS